MVFIFDANGNLCNSIPENVYEGSNEANTIVVVAPWTSGTQVYMSYQLPNSLYSEPVLLTEFDTSPLPEDLKANAWSIDIDDVITQSSGRVNFQFFAVTAGKILPSASVVAGGSAIIEATVNATIFATKVQYGGQYVFEYNGEVWRLDGNAVNLSDYGITLTSGVPQSDSTLTVTYKAGSVKRQATAIVSVPINKGNEIILPETPSQTIYDQILAALATVKDDISNLESNVSTLQGEVSTLQADVSTLQTDVSDIQTTISNREFESKALLPWDSTFTYKQGDTVFHNGLLFKLRATTNRGTEPTDYESRTATWVCVGVGKRSYLTGDIGGEIFNSYSSNVASGDYSHAEGRNTQAGGLASHAEGLNTIASGDYSHAEGGSCVATGNCSHAGGKDSGTSYEASFVHGTGVQGSGPNSAAFGKYNKNTQGVLFAIGDGSSTDDRKNAFEVKSDTIVSRNISFDGTNKMSEANKAILTGTDTLATQEWTQENAGKIDSISVNGKNVPADANKNVNLEVLEKTGGTISGNLSIQGNLNVAGTTVTQDTETLLVKDNIVVTNSDKAELVNLSGLAINKNANQTYGIMYDPTTDSVKLGLGTIDETGKFTFSENGNPVAVRADSSLLVDGHLIKWDATNNRFVDSGKSVDDFVLKGEIKQDYQIVTAEPEDKSQGKMIYEKSSGVTLGKGVVNKTLVDEFYSSPSDFLGKFSDGTATASDMENYEYLLSSSGGFVIGYINIGNLPELTQYVASSSSFDLLFKVNNGEEQTDTLTLDTSGVFYVGTKLTVLRTNKLGETTGVPDDYYTATIQDTEYFAVATTDTIQITKLKLGDAYINIDKGGSEGPFAIENLKIADGTQYKSLKDLIIGDISTVLDTINGEVI